MDRRKYKNNDGFTLIETLVAIMLLAISLTIIMQLFSGGMRAVRLSNGYDRAVFYAQELIDEFLMAPRLSEEVRRGTFEDGYQWAVEILPMADATGARRPNRLTRFSIKATVQWPIDAGAKEIAMETIGLSRLFEPDTP